MKLYFSCLFLLLFSSQAVYSSTSISYLQLHLDTVDLVTSNTVRLGVITETNKGYQRRTRGLLAGIVSWKRVKIRTEPPMEVDNGVLVLDHTAIEENNGVVVFNVSVKKKNTWYRSAFKRTFATLQNIELDKTTIEAYKYNSFKVKACFTNGNEYVVNGSKRLPGLSMSQIEVEGPNYTSADQYGISYSPDWSTFYSHIPVCVKTKNSDWSESYIDVSYNVEVSYRAVGENGEDGHDGYAGQHAPRAGYESTEGTDGTDGTAGIAPSPIHVYQKKMEDVYLVWLIHEGNQLQYIFNEQGRLKIFTKGGTGGNGGDGGRGGDGADGTSEYEETFGSSGGDGGNGGNGGNGGDVNIYYANQQDLAKHLIEVGSIPGNGGIPGKKGKGGFSGSEYVAENEESSLFSILAGAVLLATRSIGSKHGVNGSSGKAGVTRFYSMNQEELMLIDSTFNVQPLR